MKIVFAGTPDFAVAPLKRILDGGYEVVGVITQADKPQGRKGILTPPPVKTLALEYGVPVLQPVKLRDELESVKALGGDIMITCAYGQILTQAALDLFPLGVWNIHAGLLPQYRGASPIQSCILAGETQTGVSVMRTELGIDSGAVLCVERTGIGETETYGELSARLSLLGAGLIVKALETLKTGDFTLIEQGDENVRIVRKIGKENARIRFDKPAKEIVDLVRAMNPAPVAFAELDGLKINVYRAEKVENETLGETEKQAFGSAENGEILNDIPKLGLLVKCQDGVVKLTEVQAAGGKRMSGSDLLNGRKAKKGQVFVC